MTRQHETPKVLHIQECDEFGNVKTVRYYREDVIHDFVKTVTNKAQEIYIEAESRRSPESRPDDNEAINV